MLGLVARLRKVKVVRDNVVFVCGSKADLHIKLTPSFFLDSERGVLDNYYL